MAASGASPFAAVAQSTTPWSGWETQKPTTFESKPLFATPSKPATLTPRKEEAKKQEANEKKTEDNDDDDDDDDDDVEYKYEDEDDEFWDADPESQLENGDQNVEKPGKKNVDTRERSVPGKSKSLME